MRYSWSDDGIRIEADIAHEGRTWAATIAAVTVIATPVAIVFARAQWELQRAKDALEDLSRTDPLTGLPNRRALMEASEAPTSHTMVLVIADVDRFKAVNDTYGHRAGDAVLQTVGRIMTQHLARYGLVGRLGGEEFALISSNASPEQIIPALRDLLHAIEMTPFVTSGGAFGSQCRRASPSAVHPSRSIGCIRRLTRRSIWPSAPAETGLSCPLVPRIFFLQVRWRITKTSQSAETWSKTAFCSDKLKPMGCQRLLSSDIMLTGDPEQSLLISPIPGR